MSCMIGLIMNEILSIIFDISPARDIQICLSLFDVQALLQFMEIISKHTVGIRLYKRHHLHERPHLTITAETLRYLYSELDWGDGFDYDDHEDYDVWDDQND